MTKRDQENLGSRAGLSLMELLIALALMALVAGGMAASLGFALRIYDRTDRIDALNSQIGYRLRLRDWLASAASPALKTSLPVEFTGNEKQLVFVSLAETPFAPDAAGLKVTARQFGKSIEFEAVALSDDGKVLEVFEGILASNVTGFQIAYLPTGAAPTEWLDTWHSTSDLPAAIRITAKPGSVPPWPDFVVRPLLGNSIY